MVGEKVPPDDEQPRDDEEPFILDDWDEELDIVAQVDAEVDQQLEILNEQQGRDGGADVGSVGSPFVEDAPSEWAGASRSAAEIGIGVPGGTEDVQEIDLGQEESGPDAAADAQFFGDAPRRQPQSLSQIQPGVIAGDSGTFASSEDWTPLQDEPDAAFQLGEAAADEYAGQLQDLGVPEEDEQLASDEAGAGDAGWEHQAPDEQEYEPLGEEAEEYDADAAPVEYAEEYDYGEEPAPVAAGPALMAPVRRRTTRIVATLAAVIVIGLVAATVVLKPEWLGVTSVPLVDRTEIARPSVALRVEAPVAEFLPDPVPPVVVDRHDPVDPAIDPGPDPGPDPDPVVAVPLPDVALPEPPPPAVDPLPGDPLVADAQPPAMPADGLVAIGDDLRIGGRVENREAALGPRHAIAANLIAGSQALVKLKNGNYFIGTVTRFDAALLSLRVQGGHVHLLFDDMTGLVSLSEAEFKALQAGKSGFVRLRNRNRLFGSIEDLGLPDSVVLASGGSRVIIPREAIEEIGESRKDGVQVTDDLDDSWMRQLVEQRLRQHRETKPADEQGR